MTDPARVPMTAEEFIAWAMARTDGERYELVAGEVVAMAPERLGHTRLKGLIYRRMTDAIRASGLDCEAFVDGMAVRVGADTVYEPDCLVRCGPPLDDDVVELIDPVIVVEVLSPATRGRDSGAELEDYFRIPSLRHYLIVKTENRAIIHHTRNQAKEISTRIVRDWRVRLDPPGIDLDLA
jgi:Uma2 family endonuclease